MSTEAKLSRLHRYSLEVINDVVKNVNNKDLVPYLEYMRTAFANYSVICDDLIKKWTTHSEDIKKHAEQHSEKKKRKKGNTPPPTQPD